MTLGSSFIRRIWRGAGLAMLLLLFFIPDPEARPMVFTDARGITVRFEKPPGRIVSLVPAATEILFEIGAGQRVVGVTYHDTLLPFEAEKVVVGGYGSPDKARIEALRPDLVLVGSLHTEIARQCERKGIVTFQPDLSTLERSLATITTLGHIVQCVNGSRSLHQKRIDGLALVARKTQAIPSDQRPRVMRMMGGSGGAMTPGDDSFQNEMIRAAGAIAPRLGKKGAAVALSLEEWRDFNPQVVYGCDEDKPDMTQWFQQPGWKEVDAVRDNRVYYFPCDLTCRAGAHVDDFVAWLAARLYGDRLAEGQALATPDQIVARRPLKLDLAYVRGAEVIDSRIYDFIHKTLLVTFSQPLAVVSTLQGPMEGITAVGNHFFPSPCWYIGHQKGVAGLESTVCSLLTRDSGQTALLYTGADMDHLSVGTAVFRRMTVHALVTAGAKSNAMRAAKDEGRFYEPGTINIVVMPNMRMTLRAMTLAIVAATEAKSAALQDLDIRSSFTPRQHGATGTGTDNVIVVQGTGPSIDLSGGHSKMGELISRAVYQGVREALFQQNGFSSGRNILLRLKERQISIPRLLRRGERSRDPRAEALIAQMEKVLLEPPNAAFMAAALSVSDDFERGLVTDLSSFETWARAMAGQVAGKPMASLEMVIAPADLPPVLHMALNALANGATARISGE